MLTVSRNQCYHCGEALVDGILSQENAEHSFCCPGCRTAWEIIHSTGLGDYYIKRNDFAARPADTDNDLKYDLWEEGLATEAGKKKGTFSIPALHCPSCIWLSERILKDIPGIESYRISLTAMRLSICYDPAKVRLRTIAGRLARTGYGLFPVSQGGRADQEKQSTRDLLQRMGVAGFFSGNMMILSLSLYAGFFSTMDPHIKNLFHIVAFLFTLPVLLYSARPIFQSALALFQKKLPGMEILTVSGIGIAFFYSSWVMLSGNGEVYFDSITFVVFALLCSRYLEQKLRLQTTYHLENLYTDSVLYLLPERTMLRPGAIEPGMHLEIPAKTIVPVDGILLDSKAELDESFLTGEFRAVERFRGQKIFSGSKTIHPITIEAETSTKDGTLARLRHWIDQALVEDPAERFFKITSQVFTIVVLAMAFLTLLFYWQVDLNRGISATIALLIVACPCALALAVPVARIVGLSQAYRQGILVKNASRAFTPLRLTKLFIDKTGTVSQGRPELKKTELYSNVTVSGAILLAAALEKEARSGHPLAEALQRAAADVEGTAVPLPSPVHIHTGQGLGSEDGQSSILLGSRSFLDTAGIVVHGEQTPELETWLARDGKILARFVFDDALRPEAREVLRKIGLPVVLLSGDRREAVAAIATELGIEHFLAGQLPMMKKEQILKARQEGRVAFFGDGLNDTVALKAADLSFSFVGRHELLHNSADVLFLREELPLLERFFAIRKRTAGTMKQNLILAFLYNLILLPLAMVGWLAPVVGAIFMGLSSISVTVNALRRG
ncbi:MAG: heavy metal translocating P-type ATPase [Spirochaetales bacterium]|nr:heavy metal translocating P-type ATPase [Spirochaetales bacterium]